MKEHNSGIEPQTPRSLDECYAFFSEQELCVGNEFFERRWRLNRAHLEPISLLFKKSGQQWFRPIIHSTGEAPAEAESACEIDFSTRRGRKSALQNQSLQAGLVIKSDAQEVRYDFQIFPEAHGALMQVAIETRRPYAVNSGAQTSAHGATGIETSPPKNTHPASTHGQSTLESFTLAPQHLLLSHVTLRDQTDIHNELVLEHEYLLLANERALFLQGNIFVLEDTLAKQGLIYLKLAPLPHARPVRDAYDLSWNNRVLSLPAIAGDASTPRAESYPWALLCYDNGRAGRIAALQNFQRQLRRYEPARDGMFLSNTWGDRSRDACIEEEFIAREIEAGARLGVDVIQIDDGWQSGVTANSAQATNDATWTNFWEANPDFWEPNPARFPHGLKPLVEKAREKNIRFGLWFAPDSANDFANWHRDADKLLQMHRELGIEYFKLDAIKQETASGEANLHQFFDRVLGESNGKIVLDLDVTAEVRPGYYGRADCGPIFIENRYTDWRSYWPHSTLRAAWQLAHWVDPLRLRVEFLNNTRNLEQYSDDPLAPSRYSPEYLFATTMFFNPLGWFEMQHLPPEYLTRVGDLAALWKLHRAKIFSGTIFPIGEMPDGTSWTGFASISPERNSAYILGFRELNQQPEYSLPLPLLSGGNYRATLLAGSGNARWENGKLQLQIACPQEFIFLRLN